MRSSTLFGNMLWLYGVESARFVAIILRKKILKHPVTFGASETL